MRPPDVTKTHIIQVHETIHTQHKLQYNIINNINTMMMTKDKLKELMSDLRNGTVIIHRHPGVLGHFQKPIPVDNNSVFQVFFLCLD